MRFLSSVPTIATATGAAECAVPYIFILGGAAKRREKLLCTLLQMIPVLKETAIAGKLVEQTFQPELLLEAGIQVRGSERPQTAE